MPLPNRIINRILSSPKSAEERMYDRLKEIRKAYKMEYMPIDDFGRWLYKQIENGARNRR